MFDLIPPFDLDRVVMEPWLDQAATNGWILLTGVLVTAACALVGNYRAPAAPSGNLSRRRSGAG